MEPDALVVAGAAHNPDEVEVVVVGGSAAGLSAALALGRSRRSVLVIDSGNPRNASSAHLHGVLGHDGLAPADFAAVGRRDVERYGVQVQHAMAVGAARAKVGLNGAPTFDVFLDNGHTIRARRILVASGVTDHLPEIEGVRERWGTDVIHCPYCHGWENRDRPIAVVSTTAMGAHSALLFRQWSPEVTLFTHTGAAPSGDELAKLEARDVNVVSGVVRALSIEHDRIVGVTMTTGETFPAEVVVVGPRAVAYSPVLEALGLSTVPHSMGPEYAMSYESGPTGQTAVAGVWAAGNVVDAMAPVASAVSAGYMAGAMLNMDLVNEDTEFAVTLRREIGRQLVTPPSPGRDL